MKKSLFLTIALSVLAGFSTAHAEMSLAQIHDLRTELEAMDQSLDSQYAQITQTAARGREIDRRLRLCHSNFGNTLYYLQQVPKYNIPDLIYIWRAACDVVVLTKELQMADFGIDKTGTSRPRYAQLLSAVQESGQPEKLAAMVNTVEALKKQVLVQHAYRELSFGQLMDHDLVRTYVDGKYYQDGYGE